MRMHSSTIVGSPVTVRQTSRTIETVKALLINHHTHHISGFVVDRGGWTGSARMLPWNAATIQPDGSVTVATENTLQVAAHDDNTKHLLYNYPVIPSVPTLKLKTSGQHAIGKLRHITFNPETGVIQHYEIERGLPRVSRPLSLLARTLYLTYHDNALFVRNPTAVVTSSSGSASLNTLDTSPQYR